MPVRNGVLGRASLAANTSITLTTVPLTETFLIKHIQLFNIGANAVTAYVQVRDVGGAIVIRLLNPASIAAGQTVDWFNWAVAGPGDTIEVSVGNSTFYVSVEGAALPGHL